MNKNGYFRILDWAHQQTAKGVSYNQYLEFVSGLGVDWGAGRKDAVFRELFSSVDKNLTHSAFGSAMTHGKFFHLSVEASFRHLEMVELNEARQSSRSATWIAIAAIFFTAVIGVVQIAIAVLGTAACV